MRTKYDRLTTTIKRPWLAEIIAGTKTIEYRQIKRYWTKRLNSVTTPFELRLLNGMNPPIPEVTVLIHRVTTNRTTREYGLYLKRILSQRWATHDRRKPAPGFLFFILLLSLVLQFERAPFVHGRSPRHP